MDLGDKYSKKGDERESGRILEFGRNFNAWFRVLEEDDMNGTEGLHQHWEWSLSG